MSRILRQLRARLKYRRHAEDLAKEIELHRELIERDAARAGAASSDARRHAARALGNTTIAREDARGIWIARWADSLLQDARYALRMLRRNPGFAATAIGALVLGISLNVSLFTVFNTAVLHPWAVPNPERVVLLQPKRAEPNVTGVSPVEARYLHARARSADVVTLSETRMQLGADPTAPPSPARLVSANYFSTLKLGIQLGQGFMPSDDEPNTARAVIVLGARAWRTQFSADPAIVGRSVLLNNVPFIVVGVAADGVQDSALSPPPDVFVPVSSGPLLNPLDKDAPAFVRDPSNCCVKLAARLHDGVSAAAAGVEFAGLDAQFLAEQPQLKEQKAFIGTMRTTSTRMLDLPQAERFVPAFGLMFAGTGLLLLLACANVGNLLLARAMSRQREIGVRLSLGAGRGRVVRQLLTEGLVIAAIASLLALPIVRVLPDLVMRVVDTSGDGRFLDFGVDRNVLLFAIAITFASSLLFSLAPAMRGTRAMSAGVRAGRGASTSHGLRLRTALLVVQVAISAVLLVAASLLSRGIIRATSADLGFRSGGVLAATVSLPRNAYSEEAEDTLGAEFETRLASANIGPIGATSVRPMSQSRVALRIPLTPDGPLTRVEMHHVSPGYFELLDLRITAGRAFIARQPNEVVVNRSLAHLLGGDSAIGTTLRAGKSSGVIVGIVEDAQLLGLGPVSPAFFRASTGFPPFVLTRDSAQAAAMIRATVASLGPRATVTVMPLSDGLRDEVLTAGVGAGVATTLALAAILLASIGVFGVFSFMVTERRREIGVRLALGATNHNIVRSVLGGAAIAITSGLAVGLALSLAAGAQLSGNLYGLSPRDPVAFVTAIGVLALAGAVSTLLPVRRALNVDPSITLRQE